MPRKSDRKIRKPARFRESAEDQQDSSGSACTNSTSVRAKPIPARAISPRAPASSPSNHRPTTPIIPPTPPPVTPSHPNYVAAYVSPGTPTPAARRIGVPVPRRRGRRGMWQQQQEQQQQGVVAESGPEVEVEVEIDADAGVEVEVQPPEPVGMPVFTSADDHNFNSSGFGLKHTPEWDGIDIDINDDRQPRWCPPALLNPPSYENLTPACKLMLVQECTKRMTFKSMVTWLQLTDTQLIDFIQIYESQTQRASEEERLKVNAMNHLDIIRRVRALTAEDWVRVMELEVDSNLTPSLVGSPIPEQDIGRTIGYLLSFHVYEELVGFKYSVMGPTQIVSAQDTPRFRLVQDVIESMKRYTKLGVEWEWDMDHDTGLREYITRETDLAEDADEVILSDDEEIEVVVPVKRPVGRPKKQGSLAGNKAVRNKIDRARVN